MALFILGAGCKEERASSIHPETVACRHLMRTFMRSFGELGI
jgi:hypothetical protein